MAQSEIEKLEIKYQASENEINLTKDEERIINFYNDSSFNMYHGITDSRVKIKVELTEPLRALPSTNSPYYMRGLTYSTTNDLGNKFQEGTFEGELIYTTTDSGKFFKRWYLVIIEGTMGYVPEDSIIEFTNLEYSYDTKESLVGLELGMSVDKLEKMYSNSFEHIINKSDYLRFIKIDIAERHI